MASRRLISGAFAVALAACRKEPPRPTPTATPRRAERTPLSQAELSTDPAELSLHNLESQIDGQRALVTDGKNIAAYANLVRLLVLRGNLTGELASYALAADAATQLIEIAPNAAIAWEAEAQVDSTYHRFAAALADYEHAIALGEKPASIAGARVDIEAAQGTSADEVHAYRVQAAKDFPSISSLMSLAIDDAERGDLTTARTHFAAAQDRYRDVSPFPLALLYFQEGLVEERQGSLARARELFLAAHERLPEHAQSTSHLAAVLAATGDRPRAIALLSPLAAADDPEYAGQLAALLDDTDSARAIALRKDAIVRYERLLMKLPLAFADHAARFYLLGPTEQRNAARAHELARDNARNRSTLDATRLVIDAAIAAGDADLACSTADAMLTRSALTPESHVAAARAFTACGQKERAASEVALVAGPR